MNHSRTRALLVFGLCSSFWSIQSSVPRANQHPDEPAPISVKLVPVKSTFAAGEEVRIDVQILNIGKTDIFVGRKIPEIANWIYSLNVAVVDKHGNVLPQLVGTLDVRPADPKEEFSRAVIRDWILLPPGYYIGTTIILDPNDYKGLDKPGQYEILAQYSSMGMDAPLYYNRLRLEPEKIGQLAYKSWKGQVESNSVWITILPKATRPPNRPSTKPHR